MTKYIVLILILIGQTAFAQTGKTRVIVDTDTANEIDDLYAILRTLVEPSFDVVGLTASQWHTQPNAPGNTAEKSHELNQQMLRHMGLENIPHFMGSNTPMPDTNTPAESPASDFIIKQAHKTPDGEKLTIFTFGAMTNVASAVAADPSIANKIQCYVMGMRFDADTKEWNFKEFNVQNDVPAMKCLMQTNDLELHIMTATASRPLQFKLDKVMAELKGHGGVWDYVVNRWQNFIPPCDPDKSKDQWIMWDIAVVEAFINSNMATEIQLLPPDNLSKRKIWVYTKIDEIAMQKDYWNAIKAYRTK